LGSVSPEENNLYFVMHTHPEHYENELGEIGGQPNQRGAAVGTVMPRLSRKSVDTTNSLFSTGDVILFKRNAEELARQVRYKFRPEVDLSILYDRQNHVFRNWVQNPYGFAEIQVFLDPYTDKVKSMEIRYVADDIRDPNKGHQYQATKLMGLKDKRELTRRESTESNPLFGIPIQVRRVTDPAERAQMENAMPYPNKSHP
jgi:hypothetical protein